MRIRNQSLSFCASYQMNHAVSILLSSSKRRVDKVMRVRCSALSHLQPLLSICRNCISLSLQIIEIGSILEFMMEKRRCSMCVSTRYTVSEARIRALLLFVEQLHGTERGNYIDPKRFGGELREAHIIGFVSTSPQSYWLPFVRTQLFLNCLFLYCIKLATTDDIKYDGLVLGQFEPG
jgi:hypothetical protein